MPCNRAVRHQILILHVGYASLCLSNKNRNLKTRCESRLAVSHAILPPCLLIYVTRVAYTVPSVCAANQLDVGNVYTIEHVRLLDRGGGWT